MSNTILFLISSMGGGGAERVAAGLVNAWAGRGDKVTLLITFSGRGECFYPISDRVNIVYLADFAGCTRRGIFTYWARFWIMRRFIRDLCPNVLVSFLTHVNIATLLSACGLGIRVIVSERTYPPMFPIGRIWGALRRMTYPMAHRVVMQTSEGLRWLEFQIPKAQGVVIPNPVTYPLPSGEPVLLPAKLIAPERNLLLAVGRLDVGKQFDRLLESFAALADRYLLWDLVILGEGSERSQLERQVIALELERRVLLPGRAGNMGDWYGRADLYVMSSRFEGFPNTLVEAMAHGCAAVSYDCDTGPRDIIRHEQDGLLVSPVGDVAAMVRALGRLMSDDVERERMAAQAVHVRERYSLDKILQQWNEEFEVISKSAETS